MVLLRRHKEVHHHFKGVNELALVIFIFSLAVSLTHSIWAAHLDSIVNNASTVGYINSFLMLMAFSSYFFFIPLIEKSDKAKLFLYAVGVIAFCYFLLYFSKNLYFVIFIAVLMTISATLRITSFGIMVRDYSPKKKLTQNEGLIYTLMNSAWIFGPLLASFILFEFNKEIIFLISAFFALCTFFIFRAFHFKDLKGKKKVDANTFANFREFFKNKDRVIAYLLGTGVTTWWSLIFLFVPLLLIREGFETFYIPLFLFAVAIPLVFLEYPFSKIVSKKGFKKMFLIGYFSVGLIAIICFFISDVYVLISLLILASIPMSLVEPSTEAYFFGMQRGTDKYRFYGPYNTAIDIGQLIGNLTASTILLFFPFKFIFLGYALWMFFFFFLSFSTKRVVE